QMSSNSSEGFEPSPPASVAGSSPTPQPAETAASSQESSAAGGAWNESAAREPSAGEPAQPEEAGNRPAPSGGSTTRIRIGSQRPGQSRLAEVNLPELTKPKPNPVTPVASKSPAPPPKAKSYPPPNTRDKLTPEMEVELAEALGGLPLDEMIAGTTGIADA